MNAIPFIFLDGWRIFSDTGHYVRITDSELENYEENGLSHDEIKSIVYSYLTSTSVMDFSPVINQSYEFWYKNCFRFNYIR